MNYTQWYAQHGLLQKHEQWFVDNVILETIVGSHCYGCQTENSDYDVITILLPKYEHLFPQSAGYILGFDELPSFSRKELKGKSRTIVEKKPVEIEWVSLIEFFVHAGLKSSPNLMECLFTRRNFVTVGTSMGYLLRDKRKLFISMKTFKAFCGYANGQMHRIRNRKPETDERQQLIEKYGYDCYIEETEFLTNKGWKKYDAIFKEKLATVDKNTGNIEFQRPLSRIKKYGSYKVYEMEKNFTKFVVTENHNILNSYCPRSKTTKYDESKSNWNLTPIKILSENKRSWYHIRTTVNNNREGLGKDLDELILIGIYLSEGSVNFRKGKIKSISLSQTKNGKKEVFEFLRRVMPKFGLKEYTYTHKLKKTFNGKELEETVWITHKKPLINKIVKDFGKVKNKKYPSWVFNLSDEEASALRYGMFIGDGTAIKKYKQEIYYSTVKNLNDLFQILALLSGYNSNIMGPYKSYWIDSKGNKRLCISYQTLVSKRKKSEPEALCINTTGITKNKDKKLLGGKTINYLGNVVCFEVPNETLITRLGGKIAIQGNCKMAFHTLRLTNQLEQILTDGDIDLMQNKEELKLMRAGEWGDFDRFDREFQKRMDHLEELSRKSNLAPQPQIGSLRMLLLEILEHHFKLDENKKVGQNEYVSAKEVKEQLDRIEKVLNEKFKN